MTRLNIDLSELLAPIRQMREEIQKMNDALKATVQLQSQMAAHQRQSANKYSPTTSGLALEIQDKIITRGGPSNNVYSIGTGAPIPPSNVNPIGMPIPSNAWQVKSILNQKDFAPSFAGALANQAEFGLANSKKERDELIKTLGSQTDKSAQMMRGLLLQQVEKFSNLEKIFKEQTANLEIDPETGKILNATTTQLQELNKTIKELNKTNTELASVQAAATTKAQAGGPGGPTDGGPPSLRDVWKSASFADKSYAIAGAGLQAAGVGFKIFGEYKGFQSLGMQQDFSVRMNLARDVAAVNQYKAQEYMAQVAPTTGEQFVKTYGNLLTPGKETFKYLGLTNRVKAQREAEQYTKLDREAEATRLESERASGIGGILSGFGGASFIKFLGSQAGRKLLETQAAKMAARSAVAGAVGSFLPVVGNLATGVIGTTASAALMGYSLIQGYREYKNYEQTTSTTRTGLEKGGSSFAKQQEMAKYGQEVQKISETLEKRAAFEQAELSSVQAKRLSMGIDENLAAMRMRTAATSMAGGAAVSGFEIFKNLSPARAEALAERYAKLGYSIPEVGQIYNTYAGVMGTTQGAGKLLGLSRAGVGSVEQIAGNVLGISAVSGKKGDLKQLEDIFAKAFEAGLKGAPSIQRFSQAAVEMSAALKIQSATGAAGFLSTLTGAMAGKTGSAAMYLEEAKTGLAGLAATTGATTGFMGAVKVMAGAGAGLNIGTGLGAVSRSNIVQVQEALQQLETSSSYTSMTGLARKMVGAQMASGMSESEAIAQTRKALQGQMSVQAAPFAAEYKRRTGVDFSTIQEKARKILEQTRGKDPKKAAKAGEQLRNLMYQFEDQTTGMAGLEAEGSATALLLSGVSGGDFKRGQKILAAEKAKGAGKAAMDFATVQYKKALNKAAVEAYRATEARTEVSEKELLKTAESLGIEGSAEQKIQTLRGAAGLKQGDKMGFAQLSTAISLLSDKEELRAKNTIIQEFSEKATQQLSDALRGEKKEIKKFNQKPEVDAPILPSG